jgi:hypothetical protein
VSPTDPPLPPSPDEPADEPQWDGGGGDEPTAPLTPDEEPAPPTVPGEPLEPSGIEPGEEPTAEQPTEVVPAVDLTEPLPETEGEPTEVMPPTGVEPTEVIVGGVVAADGTGEFTREHRRRVSHRRYVMRRIGVGLAALAIIGGAVWLLVVLLGDDDESAGGTDTTTPVTSEAAAIPPTTRAASTTTAAPATTEADAVEITDAPEATDPTTTAAPEETEPDEQGGAATTDATEDTATESSPPGTVVYDLSSEPTCTIGQTLREGSTGPQVQCLQERLNEVTVGGTPLNADGVYGEQTADAVRAFQEANELTPDGIVGPTTGGALGIWPE